MFCKHLLGDHKGTTTEGVLLELGKISKELEKEKENVVLSYLSFKVAIKDTVEGKCRWLSNIRKILENNDMQKSKIVTNKKAEVTCMCSSRDTEF